MSDSPFRTLLVTSKCYDDADSDGYTDSLAPPIGLFRLRHSLQVAGIDCDVVDLDLYGAQYCYERVQEGLYDVIGASVTHWNMTLDLELLWKLKGMCADIGKQVLFIAGGQSATANYKQWLDCGFEVVCLGYGERAIQEIALRYQKDKSQPIWELAKGVDGVAYYDQDRNLCFRKSPPLTQEEFSQLAYVHDMEMDVNYDMYWDHMRGRVTDTLTMNNRSYVVENARLYTSSRCLARCGFCSCDGFLSTAQGTTKQPLEILTAEEIHKLIIHHCNKYGARAFSINDDDFLLGNRIGIDRAMKLCELIIESKNNGEIPPETKFSCQTRISNFLQRVSTSQRVVNHELMSALYDASFHNISMGVETFSQRLLNCPSINKPMVSIEDYHTVLNAIMEHGLFPTMNLILGIPEGTSDELVGTLMVALDYLDKPCQISLANRVLVFPGAPIWESKQYPSTFKVWTHPETGEEHVIRDYAIPHHEDMADLFKNLGKASRQALRDAKIEYGWTDDRLIPRTGIALTTFMAIAETLERLDLKKAVREKMNKLFRKECESRVEEAASIPPAPC